MKHTFTSLLFVLTTLVSTTNAYAQKIQDGKLWLNEDGSNYFKVTLISQVWIRNTSMNPGKSSTNRTEKWLCNTIPGVFKLIVSIT